MDDEIATKLQRALRARPEGDTDVRRIVADAKRRGRRRKAQREVASVGAVMTVLVAAAVFGLTNRGPATHTEAADQVQVTPSRSALNASRLPHNPPSPAVQTLSHIDLTKVHDDPNTPAVAALLDTYFSGINAHDVRRATSVFAPDGAVSPDDPSMFAVFARGIRTSTDDHIAVLGIRRAGVSGRHALLVHVTFRSRQAAAGDPNGKTCMLWNIVFRLVESAHHIKLSNSPTATHQDC